MTLLFLIKYWEWYNSRSYWNVDHIENHFVIQNFLLIKKVKYRTATHFQQDFFYCIEIILDFFEKLSNKLKKSLILPGFYNSTLNCAGYNNPKNMCCMSSKKISILTLVCIEGHNIVRC